jgi:hypothetical protein
MGVDQSTGSPLHGMRFFLYEFIPIAQFLALRPLVGTVLHEL